MASLACLFACHPNPVKSVWMQPYYKITNTVSIRISMNTIKICFNFIFLYSTLFDATSHIICLLYTAWVNICVCIVLYWTDTRLFLFVYVFAFVIWAKSAFWSLFNWNWNVFIAVVVRTCIHICCCEMLNLMPFFYFNDGVSN